MHATDTKHAPGLPLFQQVKAAFILQGTTLNAWCKGNGIHRQNAKEVLVGDWNGPAGRKLRGRIIRAAKINSLLAA